VRKPLDAEAESGWWIEGKNQLRSGWLARRRELTHLGVCSSDCDVLEFGLLGVTLARSMRLVDGKARQMDTRLLMTGRWRFGKVIAMPW